MRLIHTSKNEQPVFILISSYDERHVPGGLGFTWSRLVDKAWATLEASIAYHAAMRADVTVDPATIDLLRTTGFMSADEADAARKRGGDKPTKKEMAAIIALQLTDEQVAQVHQALKFLAAVCDGARAEDGAGFNGTDAQFGHDLARAASLSRNQAAHAKIMLAKYHGQLPADLFEAIHPEIAAEEKRLAEIKQRVKDQRAADREAAKEIKTVKGVRKAGKDVVALVAKLATCDMAEFDALVEQVRTARTTGTVADAAPVIVREPAAAPVRDGLALCEGCDQRVLSGSHRCPGKPAAGVPVAVRVDTGSQATQKPATGQADASQQAITDMPAPVAASGFLADAWAVVKPAK